jgi:hypothetical protein
VNVREGEDPKVAAGGLERLNVPVVVEQGEVLRGAVVAALPVVNFAFDAESGVVRAGRRSAGPAGAGAAC